MSADQMIKTYLMSCPKQSKRFHHFTLPSPCALKQRRKCVLFLSLSLQTTLTASAHFGDGAETDKHILRWKEKEWESDSEGPG